MRAGTLPQKLTYRRVNVKFGRTWIVVASLALASQVGGAEGQSEKRAAWCVNAPPHEREEVVRDKITERVNRLLDQQPLVLLVCGEQPLPPDIRGGPLNVEWARKLVMEIAYYKIPEGQKGVPPDEERIAVMRYYVATKPPIGAWNVKEEESNYRLVFDPSKDSPGDTFADAAELVFSKEDVDEVSVSIGISQ